MTDGKRDKPRWEGSKFLCISAIVLGCIGLSVQCVIDIFQGVNSSMDWPTWLTQAWQMALPTGYKQVFAGICGAMLKWERPKSAAALFLLVGVFMVLTASNSMDFLSDQTVARTQAQLSRATAAKDITAIQNETILKERAEKTETLWRTYVVAKSPADKDRVLKEIKEATADPIALQAPDVQVVAVGVGGTIHKYLSWVRPEAVQEVRAVVLPISVMLGSILGITLGVAGYPKKTAETWKATQPARQVADAFPANVQKLSKAEARTDLISMTAHGAHVGSGRELSQRWGVNEGTVSKWLGDFAREGIIKRQPNGQRRGVVGATIHHISGNGRLPAS